MTSGTYNIESGEDKAWRELSLADHGPVARRSLASFDATSGNYTLAVFGEEYLVSPSSRAIANITLPARPPEYLLGLAIPVYLTQSKLINPSGELVKEFTGGEILFKGSHVLPTGEIAVKFGHDAGLFIEAGKSELGGVPVSLGDAAVEFRPFPRVSMTMILWLGDEEFPARLSLLFDGNADRHLPMDVLWAVALVGCRRMANY